MRTFIQLIKTTKLNENNLMQQCNTIINSSYLNTILKDRVAIKSNKWD